MTYEIKEVTKGNLRNFSRKIHFIFLYKGKIELKINIRIIKIRCRPDSNREFRKELALKASAIPDYATTAQSKTLALSIVFILKTIRQQICAEHKFTSCEIQAFCKLRKLDVFYIIIEIFSLKLKNLCLVS